MNVSGRNIKQGVALCIVSALLLTVGCDRVATGELQPGQSTVADMKQKMGEPASVFREGDREVWEYPLGPEGVRTYMMTVNAQGTLERIDQVLTEANWSRALAMREPFDERPDHALYAEPAPAGQMTVVLGSGWPGILLHEAVGHGLEGDFNRKKTSAFAGLMGQRIAAPGVTVLDDGTMPDRRGSITVDDEGTPSARNVLIEDGILVGFMQDRQNARLMGVKPTGNGRRESYAHIPMPRMTNTYMLNGDKTKDEIVGSIKRGLYATNFGGGQVDITSGKFVFSASEAFWVENGRIQYPVKGATLVGSGPESLKKVSLIGNDLRLDTGVGTCGKEGQSVPVGVGQPTLRIDGLTVGGTA